MAQPVGQARAAEGLRQEAGIAPQRGREFGFQIGGIHLGGAHMQAMRARRGGLIAVVAGECQFAGAGGHAIQHHPRAIDLRVRRRQFERIRQAGHRQLRIANVERAGPAGHRACLGTTGPVAGHRTLTVAVGAIES